MRDDHRQNRRDNADYDENWSFWIIGKQEESWLKEDYLHNLSGHSPPSILTK